MKKIILNLVPLTVAFIGAFTITSSIFCMNAAAAEMETEKNKTSEKFEIKDTKKEKNSKNKSHNKQHNKIINLALKSIVSNSKIERTYKENYKFKVTNLQNLTNNLTKWIKITKIFIERPKKSLNPIFIKINYKRFKNGKYTKLKKLEFIRPYAQENLEKNITHNIEEISNKIFWLIQKQTKKWSF